MQNMKTRVWMAAVGVSVSMLMAGCGGGGDSGTPSAGAGVPISSPQPVETGGISRPPQTSVPTPSYAADSVQAAAFAKLNQLRAAMGVGMLTQDPKLDTAAQAHAAYLESNLASGALTALSHDEISTLSGFYAESPLARARKAGVATTTWVGEVAGAGRLQSDTQSYANDCVGGYFNTVYHLQSVTANKETVGIGFQPGTAAYSNYVCVIDNGTVTNVPPNPASNATPSQGGQQIAENLIVHSPYADESDVSMVMEAESPDPAPDLKTPGRPIMVRVNASQGNVLTVSNFQLTDSTGAIIPARILVNDKAAAGSKATVQADPKVWSGIAFLLPLSPLQPNTRYTVQFAGARDATPMSTTWSFTTGTAAIGAAGR